MPFAPPGCGKCDGGAVREGVDGRCSPVSHGGPVLLGILCAGPDFAHEIPSTLTAHKLMVSGFEPGYSGAKIN